MTIYAIEKGVPIPGSDRGAFMPAAKAMEVGDSFVIPEDVKSGPIAAGNLNKALAPKRFVSRKVDGGHRVWRVS
jgi:hypothetical protein